MSYRSSQFLKRVVGIIATAVVVASAASAQVSERVLHTFGNLSASGSSPSSSLVQDAFGRLFGTTTDGGKLSAPCGCGVVFELAPSRGGVWNFKKLYSFQGSPSDGKYPTGNLVQDAAGNLYGATAEGGAFKICNENNGCGTVFKLTRGSDGKWTETVLHSFGGAGDGSIPYSGLTIDAAGNLYGTTVSGGTSLHASGTAFKLSPNSDGTWTETILHNFGLSGNSPDGSGPGSALVFDNAGNLYGDTTLGGAFNRGTVYKLSPSSSGWTESVLYNFTGGQDQSYPDSPLVLDAAGNLYGTTQAFNTQGGTVFELTPASGGDWTEKTLHTFGVFPDGSGPALGSLVFDAAGNLYGATHAGGTGGGGTVYKLQPKPDGTWSEGVLYNFTSGDDGGYPYGVMLSTRHSLVGTTFYSTIGTSGVVFELSQ